MSEQNQDPQTETADQPTAPEQPERREQEYHPADPHFNPAHPDNEGWRSGPKPPDMPAEAGIVAMFQDPAGPIGEGDVRIEEPPPGPEFQKDPAPEASSSPDTQDTSAPASPAAGETGPNEGEQPATTDEAASSDAAQTTKKAAARRTR